MKKILDWFKRAARAVRVFLIRPYQPGEVSSLLWGSVYFDLARNVHWTMPVPFNIPARIVWVLGLWARRPIGTTIDEENLRYGRVEWCEHCRHRHYVKDGGAK